MWFPHIGRWIMLLVEMHFLFGFVLNNSFIQEIKCKIDISAGQNPLHPPHPYPRKKCIHLCLLKMSFPFFYFLFNFCMSLHGLCCRNPWTSCCRIWSGALPRSEWCCVYVFKSYTHTHDSGWSKAFCEAGVRDELVVEQVNWDTASERGSWRMLKGSQRLPCTTSHTFILLVCRCGCMCACCSLSGLRMQRRIHIWIELLQPNLHATHAHLSPSVFAFWCSYFCTCEC